MRDTVSGYAVFAKDAANNEPTFNLIEASEEALRQRLTSLGITISPQQEIRAIKVHFVQPGDTWEFHETYRTTPYFKIIKPVYRSYSFGKTQWQASACPNQQFIPEECTFITLPEWYFMLYGRLIEEAKRKD